MVRNQKILIETQNRKSEASELARAKKQHERIHTATNHQ